MDRRGRNCIKGMMIEWNSFSFASAKYNWFNTFNKRWQSDQRKIKHISLLLSSLFSGYYLLVFNDLLKYLFTHMKSCFVCLVLCCWLTNLKKKKKLEKVNLCNVWCIHQSLTSSGKMQTLVSFCINVSKNV